jgi:SAM-dependent methyltransferase
MTMSLPPLLFDRALQRSRLRRAVPAYSAANFLKVRACEDMVETLSAVNRKFGLALDLGTRDGSFGRLMHQTYPDKIGLLIEADRDISGLSEGCLALIDEEALAISDDKLDLIVSSMGLHNVNDLPGVLVQIRRALKPDGLLIAVMAGGSTLYELRSCLMEAELEVRSGYGPRIAPFAESFDLVDLLKRTGFAQPVVDTDKVVVTYAHPLDLLLDLRAMGETNSLYERPRTGLNKAILARMSSLYFARFADDEGRIKATFELITLSGWKPHESQQQPLKPGSAKMRLSDALGVREGKL